MVNILFLWIWAVWATVILLPSTDNPYLTKQHVAAPTAGKLIYLKAGQHHVQLICKADNHPKLSWRLNDNTTTFRSPVTTMLDYIVIAGTADEVLASFANLSGHAPMLPKWAYGFWQCRERYSSGKQLVETVKEFRQRNLPMDVIVQDWQYWGNQGWGVPQFDPANYPDPKSSLRIFIVRMPILIFLSGRTRSEFQFRKIIC
jgi:alpha-glucosidase (family GH31 glycosyl hydrolase)